MEFIGKALDEYCCSHTSGESDLLRKINRETHLKVLMPRMLSGHFQGRVLSMLSKMIQPKSILEIGTYTGYSALCLAEGLTKDGKLFTLDKNAELEKRVRGYFDESDWSAQIEYIIGDAMKLIPGLSVNPDLVFIDADKENYLNYYSMIIDRVPSGGYIIADNVLWSGKVLESNEKLDKDTLAIKKFNDFVQEDHRVENVLFPIRDGLLIVRKK